MSTTLTRTPPCARMGIEGMATGQTEEVLAHAAAFVRGHAAPGRQAELLDLALDGLYAQARAGAPAPDGGPAPQFIHLPLGVYAALRGDAAPAIPLAAATSLLFLGLDILDDLADGDLPAHWDGCRPAEITLVAATLLCALPQLLLAELDAPAATRAAMQETLAAGLLRMGAGQHADLAGTGGQEVSAAAVEASVAGKSGAELATFAALSALLAGATPAQVALYSAMGCARGTAGQLASDCHDLFQAAHSRDLASGTRTLPVALHLERLAGEERAAFLALLEQAREDAAAQEAVRATLRAAGVLRRCAVNVEIHCRRALRALEAAEPIEPGASGLRALIAEVSFFQARPDAGPGARMES